MKTRSPFQRARKAAFTLVELLVALGITSFIIVSLLTISVVVADAWREGNNKIFTNTEARAAFNRLIEDLECAVIRQDIPNAEWFRADGEGGTFSSPPANATRLMFFTIPTDRRLFETSGSGRYDRNRPIPGNIVAVHYQMVEQDPISGSDQFRLFGLYRAFPGTGTQNPAEITFNDALGRPDLQSFWSGRPETTATESFYISNIFDFSFTFWVTRSDGGQMQTVPLPPDSTVRVLSEGLEVNGSTSGWEGARLAAVGISMTILTREGAMRARDGDIGNAGIQAFVASRDNARTFSGMVYLYPEVPVVF